MVNLKEKFVDDRQQRVVASSPEIGGFSYNLTAIVQG
jgi:hypothetical protein